MSLAFKTQFLSCLLALLAGPPRFRLVVGLVTLTVGLAIGGAELIDKKLLFTSPGVFYGKN